METPLGDFDSGTSDVDADYEPIITAPGNDADDPLDTVIAGCVFPVDEFQQVSDGLNRHPSWTVYPGQLAKCLQAAIDITSTGDVAAEKRYAPEPTGPAREPARPAPSASLRSAETSRASRHPPSRFLVAPPAHLPPPSPAPSPQFQGASPAVPRPHPQHVREVHHLRRPQRVARPHPARHPASVGAVSRTRRAQAHPRGARPIGRRRRRGRRPVSPPGARVDSRRGRHVPSQARAGHSPEIRPRRRRRRRRIERKRRRARARDVLGAVVRVAAPPPPTTIERTDGR